MGLAIFPFTDENRAIIRCQVTQVSVGLHVGNLAPKSVLRNSDTTAVIVIHCNNHWRHPCYCFMRICILGQWISNLNKLIVLSSLIMTCSHEDTVVQAWACTKLLGGACLHLKQSKIETESKLIFFFECPLSPKCSCDHSLR